MLAGDALAAGDGSGRGILDGAAAADIGRHGDRATSTAATAASGLAVGRSGRRRGGRVAGDAGGSRAAGGERGVALGAVNDGAVIHGVDHGA